MLLFGKISASMEAQVGSQEDLAFIYIFIYLLFYLFCHTTNMMKTVKKNRFNNGEDYQKETMKLILSGLLNYCFTR